MPAFCRPSLLCSKIIQLLRLVIIVSGCAYLPVAEAAARDPTCPFGLQEQSVFQSDSQDFVVSAIIVAPTYRLAIINGETVQIGDSVGGRRVAAIADGQVTLTNASGTRMLTMDKIKVKQKTCV